MAAPGAQAPTKEVAYTDEQIEQLAAFVASLAPGPEIPDIDALDISAGDVARGGGHSANCASCHNTTGQGGALTWGKYAPTLTGVGPKYIYEAMLTGPQSMPVFNEDHLSRGEARHHRLPPVGRGGAEPRWTRHRARRTGTGRAVGVAGRHRPGLIGAAIWIGTKAS